MTRQFLAEHKRAHYRYIKKLKLDVRNAETIRYCIRLQWRKTNGCQPGLDSKDPRSWRDYAVLPILFYTRDGAEEYLRTVDVFKNLRHLRKVSCCIESVRL